MAVSRLERDTIQEELETRAISNIPLTHMYFDERVASISICITILVVIVFCVNDILVIVIIYHPTTIFHHYHL